MQLGTAATAEAMLALEPDAVVVATGARPVVPDIDTDSSVVYADSVAALPDDFAVQNVFVFDEGGHYGPLR